MMLILSQRVMTSLAALSFNFQIRGKEWDEKELTEEEVIFGIR